MDINDFRVDPKIAEDGEWITDLPGMGDLRVKVRGMSSLAVTRAQATKLRKLSRRDRERDGRPTMDAALRVMHETLLEAVLLDWDGMTSEGKPVKYSRDLATKLLTDVKYRPFADAVHLAAQIVDNARAEEIEEAAKN